MYIGESKGMCVEVCMCLAGSWAPGSTNQFIVLLDSIG